MKLNGITTVGYQRTPEGFAALLIDTDQNEILGLDTSTLAIAADDGVVVESFMNFAKAKSIKYDSYTQQYEVFFPNLTEEAARLLRIEQDNAEMRAQIAQLMALLEPK